ncbi:Phenylalanine ammonia-lyase [Rhodotorula toruloides]|nr:Phenylalanine ammonia-lyase [Rhodotorula toruloides]
MAPSLDSISHSFANGVASAKQAVNGASTSLAVAGSHLPTTQVTQVDIVEKMLAAPTDSPLELDGYSLNLGDVVSAARKGRAVRVKDSDEIRSKIDKSVEFLRSQLSMSVYGVTTGFGGSADTRTEDAISLQKALLEHQLCGVLPSSFDSFRLGRGLENSLPLEVVRGAMTIRVNSLTRGHSAVRLVVLEAFTNFLNHGITPIVPLRGTISASGDLSPLSYIAAAISGHPDSKVHVVHEGKEKILYAREAMALFNLEPVVLGPKEGLGLVNGTAVSASMATLALHDAHMLSLLSQSLTAMTVEAMVGHAGSFHPFLHDVTRPHPTQIEVAGNIRKLLEGSRFAVHHEEEVKWLGPLVSDLIHAHAVLTIEAGQSTTDNPLIDVENKTSHHGGNFQAAAVANTMEKTRLGLAQIGKLNFTQLTEMLNAGMNRGLPSCLAAEDPSLSYHCKGLDIAAAAYTSELGHLANPVTTHVQPAEMANQAVNSLALISARRTTESNDVLSLLLATHLYCVLQAIDLRAIEFEFKKQFGPAIVSLIDQHFGSVLTGSNLRDELVEKVNKTLAKRLEQTNSYDLVPRWHDAFSFAAGTVVEVLSSTSLSLAAVNAWKVAAAESAISLTRQVRETFWSAASTSSPALSYLSPRTQILYAFVREELGVKARRGDVFLGKQEVTIGSNVSKIYEAIKSGRINNVLLKMLA